MSPSELRPIRRPSWSCRRELNSGSFDDYRAVIPVAQRHGAWVHVDGAFGLWASACCRHLLNGVELADSWATDGDKWLNVPYDSGYAFVARSEAHRAAMSHRAPYLVHDQDARDQLDWNPEWSRRARGFRYLCRHPADGPVWNCGYDRALLRVRERHRGWNWGSARRGDTLASTN